MSICGTQTLFTQQIALSKLANLDLLGMLPIWRLIIWLCLLWHNYGIHNNLLKIRTICHAWDMLKLVWFVNSCVYYACQSCEIHQVLPYLVDCKAPRSFKIHGVIIRQYLVIVVLFGLRDLQTREMTEALKQPGCRTCKYFSKFLTLLYIIVFYLFVNLQVVR